MRIYKQPILAIAVGLLAISALASWSSVKYAVDLVQLYSQIESSYFFLLTLDILYRWVSVVGALGVVIWAVLAPNARSAKWGVLLVAIFAPILSIGLKIYWVAQGSSFTQVFFGGSGWDLAAEIFILFELIAAVVFAIGLRVSNKPTVETVTPQLGVAKVSANRFDPMTGQPITTPVAGPVGSGAPSNLPMIALILAFFVPLGAVIVGHISLNQMKQGLISSQNLSMAKTGLILGYVFMGLGFVFGIIFAVVYSLILSRGY